jgi:hypothetical protein
MVKRESKGGSRKSKPPIIPPPSEVNDEVLEVNEQPKEPEIEVKQASP